MIKNILAILIINLAFGSVAFSQLAPLKVNSNLNDWESLFTVEQARQLDSSTKTFNAQTNIPIALITFGTDKTSKDDANNFMLLTDSLFHAGRKSEDMAIFLSKEFRVLNFKVNSPSNFDSTKFTEWQAKLQSIFLTAAKPYIPLLKEGKYFEAISATIADLGVALKKQ